MCLDFLEPLCWSQVQYKAQQFVRTDLKEVREVGGGGGGGGLRRMVVRYKSIACAFKIDLLSVRPDAAAERCSIR